MKILAVLFSVLFSVSAMGKTLGLDTKASTLKWVGKKITGQHDGLVKIKSGSVNFDNNTLKGGEFVIDMTTITNTDLTDKKWNAKLVDHLKSDDFFNIAKHPTAKFVIKKAVAKNKSQYEVTGDLTVKGITHPVTFAANVKDKGNIKTASAKFKIDRSKWDIRYRSGKFFDPKELGDKLIYDDIAFELNLATKPLKEKKS